MSKIIVPSSKSLDVVLSIDDIIIGGQTNAILNEITTLEDVSNNILMLWKEYLPSHKTWNLICDGIEIKDEMSTNILETAYSTNKIVDVVLSNKDDSYSGKGIIIKLTHSNNYSKSSVYSLTVQGISSITYAPGNIVEL